MKVLIETHRLDNDQLKLLRKKWWQGNAAIYVLLLFLEYQGIHIYCCEFDSYISTIWQCTFTPILNILCRDNYLLETIPES